MRQFYISVELARLANMLNRLIDHFSYENPKFRILCNDLTFAVVEIETESFAPEVKQDILHRYSRDL